MPGAVKIAVAAVFASLSAALPAKVPADFVQHRYLFAAIDLPEAAVETQPGTFSVDGATIILDASTPHYDDRSVDCAGGILTYKRDRPNLFAYSCASGAEIVYSITRYGRTYRVGASDATEQIGYSIRYPAARKSDWDAVVAHMSRSLKFVR